MSDTAAPDLSPKPGESIPVGYDNSMSLGDCLRSNRSAFPFLSRDATDRIAAERLKGLAEMHLNRQTAFHKRSRPDSEALPK